MRRHVTDPTITVLMWHIGCHQESIGRAIRSFLDQTYNRAVLLIINQHPDHLQLDGMSEAEAARVQVHAVPDFSTRPLDYVTYGMKKVNTEAWSPMGDDDWIDPVHLEQLVAFWNEVKERTEAPLRVCVPRVMAHYEDRVTEKQFACHATSLFETLTIQEVDYIYKAFPAHLFCGTDSWLVTNSFLDKRDFPDGEPTYHWDRTGDQHVSAHESRPSESTPEGRYQAAKNFWRIKLAALASPLKPVVVPPSVEASQHRR